MPISERDYWGPELDPPPFEHPFEPEPAESPRWAKWRWRWCIAAGIVALAYPQLLGIVLALWLVVYLLTVVVRNLHP